MEFADGFASPVEMEYGGFVEPPSHLTKKLTHAPTGVPAELRTVPDYDYSLFRRSGLALPWILLILLAAAIVIGLTFWQGPYGLERSVNGATDGIPIDFQLKGTDSEGGLGHSLRDIRISMFVIASVAVLLLVFGIRAQPRPGLLKAVMLFSALLVFAVAVLACIAMALQIDQIHEVYKCEDVRITRAGLITLGRSYVECWGREGIAVFAAAVDMTYAIVGFLLVIAIVFTTLKKNWAWGPGRVSIKKSPMAPAINYPPPSPFTYIHETRRRGVWMLILFFFVLLITDFVLAIVLHSHRTEVELVDDNNRALMNGLHGWRETNNSLRLGLCFSIFAVALLLLLDLYTWRLRWFSYVAAWVLFGLACALFVCFAMDVRQLDIWDDFDCPTINTNVNIRSPRGVNLHVQKLDGINCVQGQYIGTAVVEFILAFILVLFVLYEFLFRSLATWDTFYFYADSEWLEKHALFVEATDREAYDWRKRPMETGRFYYYSPTLGIATRTPPRNFVDPEVLPMAPLY